MVNFKFIGFWQEYTQNPNHPLFANINIGVDDANKSIFLHYLNNYCKFLFGYRRLGINLLNTQDEISAYSFYSDGVWVWSSALIYYLDKHNIALPIEFTSHILANIDDEQIVSEIMNKEFINNIHSAVRYEMRFFT